MHAPTMPKSHDISNNKRHSAQMAKKKFVTLAEVGRELVRVPGMTEAIAHEQASLRAAQFIRETRERRGLTQLQLARKLGVSQARVSEIESGRGRRGPSMDLLERIASACGGHLRLEFEEAA